MSGLFDYFRPLYDAERLTEREVIQRFSRETHVVVLTGAGISAESGIPTFRGKDGIWEKINPEEVATAQALARDPGKVWRWLDEMRQLKTSCQPNHAHHTLAEMEDYFGNFQIITQNIDGLHQAAGSKDVIELHGNIWRVRCMADGTVSEYLTVPAESYPPKCPCGAILRPDVVFFNEPLPEAALVRAFAMASDCSVMLVVGTSAVVQPAASLPIIAADNGATILEFNLEETLVTPMAHYSYFGKAGRKLPAFWSKLKKYLQ